MRKQMNKIADEILDSSRLQEIKTIVDGIINEPGPVDEERRNRIKDEELTFYSKWLREIRT